MGKKSGKHYTLMTEAGERIKDRADVWQEYPRPQMKREKWCSLNGIWELDGMPVRVPFPPESVLAGYAGEVKERVVCDYVGAMTDRFAIAKYEELFIPKSWHG